MSKRNTTETSTLALVPAIVETVETNMSDVQAAAHRLLNGVEETTSGKVDLTLALAPVVEHVLFYQYGGKSHSFFLGDYLTAPAKRNKKGETVKDNAHQRARWEAICAFLGLDDLDRAEKIKSSFTECLRAAFGVVALGDRVTRSPDGNLMVPASLAFKFTDDKGEPTAAAKVAMAEARRDLLAEAKAFARLTGDKLVEPTDNDVWAAAVNLPVECSGRKQKVGGAAVSPFGDLPTNTALLTTLQKVAVEEGLAPEPDTRPGRAGDVDNTPFGKALGAVITALTPDAEGLIPVALNEKHIAALTNLHALVTSVLDTYEAAETDAAL